MPDLRKQYYVIISTADGTDLYRLTLWALDPRDAATQALELRWAPNEFTDITIEELR